MTTIITLFVNIIAKFHTKIMALNDTFGWALSDKWLHFFVIGVVGFCLLFVIQPIFKYLANHDGTIIISFVYAFTLILVITFAIEIGQKYSGSGDMDFKDILSGIAGFFVFFGVYLVLYFLYREYKKKVPNKEENKEKIEENNEERTNK